MASAATRVKNKIREQTPNFFLLINRKKEGKEKGGHRDDDNGERERWILILFSDV